MLSFPTVSTVVAFVLAASIAGGSSAQQPFTVPANSFRAPDGDVPSPNKPALSPETRGDIYMARKMYREAIDTYREGPPNSAVLANKIGIAFHQLLLLDLAKKSYERSIKLDNRYAEAINNLGTIYYSQKNFRRAIIYYKRALRYSPPSASIYSNLGTAYFGRKDYKQAAECYQRAMQLDPDVFEHHSNFGTLMMERTVQERATFHLYLAKMYAKAGASERALIYLRKALEEGIKDREKIPDIPEFASLKNDPAFKQLLTDNPKPL